VFSHCSNSEETTMSVTPDAVPTRVCAGLDWAKDDHAVCVIDPDGQVLDRFTIEHTAAGLRILVGRLLKAGVGEIGMNLSIYGLGNRHQALLPGGRSRGVLRRLAALLGLRRR